MAEAWEHSWVRLPLEGAHNVRELGGYPTASGRSTRYHRFLRSDALAFLTEADREFLYGYGVRAVLDLRGSAEALEQPDVEIAPDVAYANITLFDFDIADQEEFERAAEAGEYTAYDVYEEIISNTAAMGHALRFIADAPEGCVLFHCAVGKDRTGLIAYLLMALAGCDRWDCLASYASSRVNLMRVPWFEDLWRSDMSGSRRGHLDSNTDILEYAMEIVEREYGGIFQYVRSCGLSYEEIERLRARMLDE